MGHSVSALRGQSFGLITQAVSVRHLFQQPIAVMLMRETPIYDDRYPTSQRYAFSKRRTDQPVAPAIPRSVRHYDKTGD